VETRWGHKRGEDGGLFASALTSVRQWGGVLEHPAYSDAWAAFGLSQPPTGGGWVPADWPEHDGWTCYIEQGHYGHRARKATWLYAHGVELPALRWGMKRTADTDVWGSWCDNRSSGKVVERMGKVERNATPRAFRDALLKMARTAADRRQGIMMSFHG
jgi:hypothetical protein